MEAPSVDWQLIITATAAATAAATALRRGWRRCGGIRWWTLRSSQTAVVVAKAIFLVIAIILLLYNSRGRVCHGLRSALTNNGCHLHFYKLLKCVLVCCTGFHVCWLHGCTKGWSRLPTLRW